MHFLKQGSLADIKPLGQTTWSQEATKTFQNLCKAARGQGFISVIRSIPDANETCLKEPPTQLWLYDTVSNNNPNGIQINLALHEMGFAKACDYIIEHPRHRLQLSPSPPGSRNSSLSERKSLPTERLLRWPISTAEENYPRPRRAISIPAGSPPSVPSAEAEKESEVEKEQRKEKESDSNKNFVMKVMVSGEKEDYCLNLIKINRELFVSSAEISAMIKEWGKRKRDVLPQMLEIRKSNFEGIWIRKATSEALFEQFIL